MTRKKKLRAKSDRMYKKWLKKFSSFLESDGQKEIKRDKNQRLKKFLCIFLNK